MRPYRHYTIKEAQFIRDNASKGTLWLSQQLDKPRNSIREFMGRNGIKVGRSYKRWTPEEQEQLLELLEQYPPGEVARIMNKTPDSIYNMTKKLNQS